MIAAVTLAPALDVSYLLDRIVPGSIARPREVIRLAGGKGLNFARAAGVLRGTATVVAPLGGRIGQLVIDLAAADGIDLRPVPIRGETRMCVSAVPDEGAPTEFYEPAPDLAEAEAAAVLDAVAGLGDASWVAVTGRVPATLPLPALAAALRASGARIAVDTSGVALAALAPTRPALVKVNRTEAAELLGSDASTGELAAALRERPGGIAVVTDGAHGAVASGPGGVWRAEPDPEPGRYGIGSGDSFLAGLLHALERGDPLPEALALASAAGSANTRRPGGARFAASDVDAALGRIRVVRGA
ncbi:MAG: 1-phosphofructokinase family hexose kinase [Micrococcales bacterium]|nr:1-phosphofructokinase family hexose kinase [Micrococcales bacterium]